MASSVDDRIVTMSFESAKFEAGISASLTSLQKLSDAIKKAGGESGLENLEKSASKVNFLGIGTAIDKLKAKFRFKEADDAFSDIDKASNKVNFLGIGTAIDRLKGKFSFREADDAFSDIERGANKVTLTGISSAIDKLKGRFDFREADSAFASIERSAGRVTFSGLGKALDGITSKFSVMEGAAAVALGNIATKGAMVGLNLVKSLTVAPVTSGLKEYETQLNSVQTILANTQASGATLKDVNAALNQLNHYADKTIYNFTEMTRNIGTFTAAGVDLKTATSAIKGIANLAALSGSNSQQASTAMYQLSQAISSGRVSLQDWNSVVNAGMGGTVFQRALAQTAVQMGTLSENAVELKGKMKNVTVEGSSFRESIMAKPGEESWLTKEVLLGTLKQFTGDMTDAQLAAQGFTREQIKSIQAQAKTAEEAATKVKTLSQLIDTAKEAAGSGWAQTWMLIFGDFKEARQLFTGMSNALNGWISDSSKARNSVLKDWKELGGRKVLIEGLKNAFEALQSVLKPIKDAFREIFPAKTGKQLYDLTVRFRDFMDTLKIGPETADNLKRTFKGFFAILDIGAQIVGGIATVIGKLFGASSKGAGGILNFTGNIGDAIVKFDNFLKKGDRLHNFFENLGEILATPIRMLGNFKDAIDKAFSGSGGNTLERIGQALGDMVKKAQPAQHAVDAMKTAWSGFVKVVEKVLSVFKPVAKAIVDLFGNIADEIASALESNNFDHVFDVLQTGLLAGIFLAVKKAFKEGFKFDVGGSAMESVTKSLDTLQGSLKTMQTNIKADSIEKIAIAIALLAASALALSLVDADKLAKSMTAIGVGFSELLGVMALLARIGGFAIFAPVIGAGLILIAASIDILALAVLALSRLDWEELAKGLVGVSTLLRVLAGAVRPLMVAGPSLIAAGIGFTALAIGLNIMAGAMKIFATMKWEEIAKGLVSVALGLDAVSIGIRTMGPQILLIGPGLVLVAGALLLLAGAMKIFGSMDMGTIGKGILAIAGGLVAIGLGMRLMPLTLPLTAAGLVLVGLALASIAGTMALMGNMKWGTIGKGLVGIAGALIVLGLGLTGMVAALPGALALAAAAAGLALLVPVIGILGKLSWGTILKGLAALALTLGVLAVAGLAAGPAFVVLGLGLGALGLGTLAVGAGLKLMAGAVASLATNGAKGLAIFIAAMTAMIAALPKVIIDFIKGLVEIVAEIVKLGPSIVESLVKIGIMLIDAIIKLVPKMGEAATKLIQAILKVINQNAGPIIQAGVKLLLNFLSGIERSIGKITTSAANIIIKFMQALTSKMPQLAKAGSDLMVKFLEGVTKNLSQLVKAGAKFVIKLLDGIADNIGDLVTSGAKAVTKFLEGIGNNLKRVAVQGAKLIGRFFDAIVAASLTLIDAAAKAILNFIHGVADAIRKYDDQLAEAAADLGAAIIEGMVTGLVGLPAMLLSKLVSPVVNAVNSVGQSLGILSKNLSISQAEAERSAAAIIAAGKKAAKAGRRSVPIDFMAGLSVGTQNILGTIAGMPAKLMATFAEAMPAQGRAMQHLGNFVLNSFAKGLTGSSSEINSVISELNNKFADIIKTSNDVIKKRSEAVAASKKTIADEQANIDELLKKGHSREYDDIQKSQNIIDRNNVLIGKNNTIMAKNAALVGLAKDAQNELNLSLDRGQNALLSLAREYEKVNSQLEKAKQVLDEAFQARDDATKSLTEQYQALPDLDQEATDGSTQLAKYVESLTNQAAAVSTYQKTLAELRRLGLDDKTYQKLLDEGTADQKFADALLAGGETAIAGLKTLDEQLNAESAHLALDAGHDLYDAGIAAAQGLVDGLNKRKAAVANAMSEIADAMVAALKKKLKIKSPSKEFEEIGIFSSAGLVKGLRNSSKGVSDAAASIGDDAMHALRDSMGQISTALANEIDPNPVIRPILDLSHIQSEAKKLDGLGGVTPITAATSYGQAASISAAQMAAGLNDGDTPTTLSGAVLKFEQTNISPKALSETEIYRQTNNQLSQAKRALGLP